MQPVRIEILLSDHAGAGIERTRKGTAGLSSEAKAAKKEMAELDKTVSSADRAVKRLVGAFAMKELVSKIAGVRGEFQQLEVAFRTMLGSASKADDLMRQLVRTAATTPFGLEDVAGGAKQLLAYGLEAEKVNGMLVRLGDIASGLTIPLNDLVYLYGTTMAQGRLYTEDFNQFMGRGIPLASELAKQFGVNQSKVKELVEAGKIGFPEVQKAIESMTDEGSRFGGLMEAQSETISGQISNIEDGFQMMLNQLGQQSEGIINGTLSGVSYMIEHYERFGRMLLGIATTYGVYRTALMTVTAMKGWATAAEMAHYNWLLLVEKAQKMLNATMLSNPYVLVSTLIAGCAVALISMKTETERLKDAEEDYQAQKQKVIEAEEEHRRKMEELCSIAGDEAVSTDTRREALNRLEQKYPDIFSKYDTEYEKLRNIKKIKEEIAAIDGEKSITKTRNELEAVNKRIRELEAKAATVRYVTVSTSAGTVNQSVGGLSSTEEIELKNLIGKRKTLSATVRKEQVNAYFEDLTGISIDTLEAQIRHREDLLARMTLLNKKYGAVKGNASTEGTFSREDLQYQLNKLRSEQNRRNKPADSSSDWVASAKKKYEDSLKAYNDFIRDTSNSLSQEEFEKKVKTLKDAVDAAKKEYDKVKPESNKDAESAAKARERQQRENERQSEMRRKLGLELVALQQENDEAEVAAMNDGLQKKLRQIRDEYNARKNAIAKQRSDWQAQNAKAGVDGLDGSGLTKAQTEELDRSAGLNETTFRASTERLYKELTDQYRSYADRRLEIERRHNEDIEALRKARLQAESEGDSEAVARIGRSITEAVKAKGRALTGHDFDVLRQSPEYVRAFEDLRNTSAETLSSLLGQLEKAKTAASSVLDPKDLREYTAAISDIMAELDSRDPFGSLSKRAEELSVAQRELAAARRQLDTVANGGKIFTGLKSEGVDADGKPVIVATYLSMGEALKKYTEAKDRHVRAGNSFVKAEKEASKSVSQLTEAIKGVGNAIGGTAGEIVGLIMDVGTFITDTINGIATVQKVGVEAVSAVEKASIILTIVSTAVQLLQKIGELGNSKAFREYEAYAEKVKEINALTDAVSQYRIAVMEARQEEDSWFAEDSLRNLRDWREYHDEVYAAYVRKAAEAQAVYRNQSGGGWLTGAFNWIMGNLSALSWWDEWRDIWGQGGYKEGSTAAINNLRIETRKKSGGLLGTGIGGHSQVTEDLVSWARKNGLGELFDDSGLIDKGLARSIIDNYGNKLVGQTRETLEALIELREKYDEYLQNLHEYVSSLYEPLVGNFVDGLWDWLDNGKDALDSFKGYASDTFRDIVTDMLRTIVIDKVIGSFSDDISALYEKYAEGKMSEKELMSGVADLAGGLIDRYGSNLPTIESLLETVAGMFDKAGIDIRHPGDAGSQSQSGRAGVYTAMSQDQGTKLEGIFSSIHMHTVSIDNSVEDVSQKMGVALDRLAKIEENTGDTARNTREINDKLEKIMRDGIRI